MTRWAISGLIIDEAGLRYGASVVDGALYSDFSPPLVYAIAWHESIQGEVDGLWPSAATVISHDGGHGLMQLTSWVPADWADPWRSVRHAIVSWLEPDAVRWFREFGFTGDPLVRAIAASYNAGFGGAMKGHSEGDLDKYTSDRYGEKVLAIYQSLVEEGKPR